MVNQTTGLQATVFDSLLIAVLAVWISLKGLWLVSAVAALAFIADALFTKPRRKQIVFASVVLAAGVLAVIYTWGDTLPWDQHPVLPALLLLTAFLFVPFFYASGSLRSLGDDTGEPLDIGRMRAAYMVAFVAVIAMSIHYSLEGFVALLPLHSSLIGALLFWVASIARKGTN